MIVSIGCDHAGPALKERISKHLSEQGHEVVNRGTDTTESVDYPDHAHAVADDVASGHSTLGILICGSANGVAMTANKHQEVRAGIAWTPEIAALAREHNDANVLCIPARFVSEDTAMEIVDAFFNRALTLHFLRNDHFVPNTKMATLSPIHTTLHQYTSNNMFHKKTTIAMQACRRGSKLTGVVET